MGYKLINMRFLNTSTRSVDYYHTWVKRLCMCNNFTQDSETITSYYYYSKLNNGQYSIATSSPQSGLTSGFYIGLSTPGSSSYYCTGFYFYIAPNGFNTNSYNESKWIVDDNNNLIYCSRVFPFNQSNKTSLGFLMSNGGVMNVESQILYGPSTTSGVAPQQIANFYYTDAFYAVPNGDDFDVFRSNMFGYDMNNNLIIRDHVQYIYSSQKNNILVPSSASELTRCAGDNAFEIIMIDGKQYIHIYHNMWIQIDSIVEEYIEVNDQ